MPAPSPARAAGNSNVPPTGGGTPVGARLRAVLADLGVAAADYLQACRAAEASGSDAAGELIAAGRVADADLAAGIARALGVSAGPAAAGDHILPDEGAGIGAARQRHLRTCDAALVPRIFIAPPLEALDAVADYLERQPDKREVVVISTLAAIERHGARRSERQRSDDARLRLAAEKPEWSARHVLSAGQGAFAATALFGSLLLLQAHGGAFWTALHWTFSLLFLGYTLFRLSVLLDFERNRRRRAGGSGAALVLPGGPIPVYTVLVALYREREMAGALVDSLSRLNWPRSRLDVKFVCEADDPETIEALRRAVPDETSFEIVVAPPSLPRTKPKALNYALPLARGEFVVLYDAEDRPHPDQLAEAWDAFRRADDRLACLQAPLTIRNGAGNWFAGLFAVEYAVLFRATLPWLARRGLPLPLGGTSNHFRRSVLLEVGGWDSHNVAEDADLGMRLARLGYRTGMIGAPTSEDAPTNWPDWRNQRTRWIKGWMQTWLVHMRDPARLARDLGLRGFCAFQVLFLGMIAASLMHTVFVGFLGAALLRLLSEDAPGLVLAPLVVVDAINVVLASLVFVGLAKRALDGREWSDMSGRLWGLWIYWLLVSFAGLRAFVHLCRQPHRWEKTPHAGPGGPAPPRRLGHRPEKWIPVVGKNRRENKELDHRIG